MPKRTQRLKAEAEANLPSTPTLADFFPLDRKEMTGSVKVSTSSCSSSLDNQHSDASSKTPAENCTIMRTKKGGFPLTCESKPPGKKVTILRNISGNGSYLLQDLKVKLGTGGSICPDGSIELQGDHVQRVERYLKEHASELATPYKKR